jgi:hypothetical protein
MKMTNQTSQFKKQTTLLFRLPALAWAGYDTQCLQATFNVKEDEVEVPITQPYTLECQQVLGNARLHSGWFQITNSRTHVTHNDIVLRVLVCTMVFANRIFGPGMNVCRTV